MLREAGLLLAREKGSEKEWMCFLRISKTWPGKDGAD